jgi:hypothetical protein
LPLRSLLAAATAPCSPAYQGVSERDLAEPTPGFDSIADALAALAAGELVVVLDDEDRENEGDLIGAADRITPAGMAFVVNHSSGVVCVGMEGADLDRLRLPLMVPSAENEEAMATAFTVTVDLREGTSTGISAADRAATLRALADPKAMPEDFKRPGHIFPLRARPVSRPRSVRLPLYCTHKSSPDAAADLTACRCYPFSITVGDAWLLSLPVGRRAAAPWPH